MSSELTSGKITPRSPEVKGHTCVLDEEEPEEKHHGMQLKLQTAMRRADGGTSRA